MSRRQVMIFKCGRYRSSNSSQRTASSARCCRLIRTINVLSAMMPQGTRDAAPRRKPINKQPNRSRKISARRRVFALARRDLRNVHGLVLELDLSAVVARLGGLQPVGVIAIRKFRLV